MEESRECEGVKKNDAQLEIGPERSLLA